MFSEVLIPYRDNDDDVAVHIGAAMAETAGTKATVLMLPPKHDGHTEVDLQSCLADIDRVDVIELETRRFQSDAILSEVRNRPGALICLASHGRDRAALLTGSLTNDLLMYGPGSVVLCGPDSTAEAFSGGGPVLAALDGSDKSEVAIPLADDWATTLERTLEIVTVLPEKVTSPELAHALASGDVHEAGYLENVMRDHGELHGHDVTFDVLHGDPEESIIEEARTRNASLIVLATHTPLGFDRLLHGSVTNRIVRHSSAPVLAIRTHETPE
ncbi:MAG: universal stress protein [Acidimicrobiales bacterium]|nr:universal stress protein [Acidimicrobiales bacterium]